MASSACQGFCIHETAAASTGPKPLLRLLDRSTSSGQGNGTGFPSMIDAELCSTRG